MADVEFIAELSIVLDSGIVHKSSKSLDAIYRKYNRTFLLKENIETPRFSRFFLHNLANSAQVI